MAEIPYTVRLAPELLERIERTARCRGIAPRQLVRAVLAEASADSAALILAEPWPNRVSIELSIRFSSISPAPGSRSSTCSIIRSAPKSPTRSAEQLRRKPSATCSASAGEDGHEFVTTRHQIRGESQLGRDVAASLAQGFSALDSGLGGFRSLLRLVLDGSPWAGRSRVFRPLVSRLALHAEAAAVFHFAAVWKRSLHHREHVCLPELAVLHGTFLRRVVRLLQPLECATGELERRHDGLSDPQ